jgi:hypothetical protein
MFLEIAAPVFDASIVALIGCDWENADDTMAAALSRNMILPARLHLKRTVFPKASVVQDVIGHLLATQKSQKANASSISS